MSEIGEKARSRLLGGRGQDAPPLAKAPPTAVSESEREAIAAAAKPSVAAREPIFLSDTADGSDVLDVTETVHSLAQLCVAPQVQTPFQAGVVGPAGAGKTFALRTLARAVESLAGSAGALARVVVVPVDASDGADAPVALASAAYLALDREPGGADYSGLIDDSAHAGGDPLRTSKAASDRHDEIVRRLEAERVMRDEVEARRARLADALLFETPGSRVDVFARARRGAIDARLRRFDLIGGSDAGGSYREFVRDMASMGPASQAGVALRAVWGYAGQRRLLFWAIVAFVLGFGLKLVHGTAVLDEIRSLPGPSDAVAGGLAAHQGWLDTASNVLYALGALLLILNIWRAIGFSTLLFRGTRLLNHELRDRRRELESRLTRLNQRVAALTAEAEVAAKHAEAAARRAGGKASTRAPGPDFLEANQNPAGAARAFLAAISKRIAQESPEAPERLVFVVDNLDALRAEAAAAWIDSAQGALGPGFVGVLAIDPAALVAQLGGKDKARRRFEKWLQAVVSLPGRGETSGERLVARLLSTAGRGEPVMVGAGLSPALTEPLSSAETVFLTALAPLAAPSPRGAKRFLNAYRMARLAKAPRPVIALMQAVALTDNEEARAAMANRLLAGGPDLGEFESPEVLAEAVKAARAANGGSIALADARASAEIAQRYALSL